MRVFARGMILSLLLGLSACMNSGLERSVVETSADPEQRPLQVASTRDPEDLVWDFPETSRENRPTKAARVPLPTETSPVRPPGVSSTKDNLMQRRLENKQVSEAKEISEAKEVPKTQEAPKMKLMPEQRMAKATEPSLPLEQSRPKPSLPRTPVSEPSLSEPGSGSIVESGRLKATLYFMAMIDEDQARCAASERRPLYVDGLRERMRVCARTLSFCAGQGTCMLKKSGAWSTFNMLEKKNGVPVFMEIKSGCVYGYGIHSSCLDPFYSVAADPKYYNPGDVIYIPALRGVRLPNGRTHNGYLVVRDKGSLVLGKGRFDIYTGVMNWKQEDNPFVKLGLNDKSTRLVYHRVTGPVAEAALAKRSYPSLPGRSELVEGERGRVNVAGVPTSTSL